MFALIFPTNYTFPVSLLIVTLVFIVLDILVGLVKAFSTTGFKSLKMREGLFHKLGEIMCVAFGVVCEICFPLVGITITLPIVSTICIYIVLMETGSIIENLAVVSPNINSLLGKVFGGYKNEDDE